MISPCLPLLLVLAAATPSGPASVQLDAAELERRTDALLSVIDRPATAERWQALGPAVVPRLVAIARDPGSLPSRRAGAIEGLVAIGGAEARAAVLQAAADEAAPWSVRASGLSGAGRLLAPEELEGALRPLLDRGSTLLVRSMAARVLAQHAPATACPAVQAQAARERGADRPHFDAALARCAQAQATAGPGQATAPARLR